MIKWTVRHIARYLGTHYPNQLIRLLGAVEANIGAVLENLADRPDALTIKDQLRRHAGDERFHAALLFHEAGEVELELLAGKRLDRRNNWIGEQILIRGNRKRIPAFRFLFWGQDPLDMIWPNLFALITLLETYSAEFYRALLTVPGWEFVERILADEIEHAALWDSHPERLLYWRIRIGLALILTVLTGGLNLDNQSLE